MFRLPFFLLLVVTVCQVIGQEPDLCENGSKLVAVLDLAKEAFQNIRNLYVECEQNNNCTCDVGQRTKSYVEVAMDLIKMAKRKYLACNSPTAAPVGATTSAKPKPSKSKSLPVDCVEVLQRGHNSSGVYTIQPTGSAAFNSSFDVFCDMETDGGGWTVIQRRGDYDVQENFFRNWKYYKSGFGNITKDFWLGNDHIYELTNQDQTKARFDLEDESGEKRYALYDNFRIDSEDTNYKLSVFGYSGDAGNAMETHDQMMFSTIYRKNDLRKGDKECALLGESGWWFNDCSGTNPNGVYSPGRSDDLFKYIFWKTWKDFECLKSVEIKIRKWLD